MPGSAETNDEFGSALNTADLDQDGYADLVVGVGGEDTADGGTDSGLVEVVWGGAKGLSGGAASATGRAHDRAPGSPTDHLSTPGGPPSGWCELDV